MASWSCSMLNSFTQDAYIGWYPFHLTKYSRFCPLSCLDLSTASTSNFGSLRMRLGGGLELCFQLGLEASQETSFKSETLYMGWTLRFSNNSNLKVLQNYFSNTLNGPAYGPKNLWIKPFSNQNSFDVQPHFISFFKIHLSSGLVQKIFVLFMCVTTLALGSRPR
jgi:hypothetical protein